jgi:1-acyl-sn-glycerol-3-phosphate acyltransferase
MAKRETIDKWSFGYWLLQVFIVRRIFNFYFSKFRVNASNKIPKGEAVILAPNHQNALLDALAFVSGLRKQTVFLARADVFKSNFLIKVLTYIKILPVYRIRDGRSELQKNDEIFDATCRVLHNKINPLCLFPEGNHGDKRQLRPLVKGIFRIAFKAQEKYKNERGVKIVPVGIDYSDYYKFRKNLFVNFGDPIEVKDFWNDYEENPPVAINKLRDHLAEEMKKVMIHIETKEYYNLYMGLRKIYNRKLCKKLGLNFRDQLNQYKADKILIEILDQCLENESNMIAEVNTVFEKYQKLKKDLNYRDWVPRKKHYSIIGNLLFVGLSLITLPLVVLGLFNNWPHFFIPLRITKGIRDKQFHSTAKWGLGAVLMMFYYLLLSILALIFLPFWWLKILYILVLPSSGIYALNYRKFIIKSWIRVRYSFEMMNKNSNTRKLKSLYDQLIELTESIYNGYNASSAN